MERVPKKFEELLKQIRIELSFEHVKIRRQKVSQWFNPTYHRIRIELVG